MEISLGEGCYSQGGEIMKTLYVVAGILLMAVGVTMAFASFRLRFGWLSVSSLMPAMVGYQLYKLGKR